MADLFQEIVLPSRYRQDRNLTYSDYQNGVAALVQVFPFERLKDAFQLARDHRAIAGLAKFDTASNQVAWLKEQNPTWSVQRIRRELDAEVR
jgi:hypothetical protein